MKTHIKINFKMCYLKKQQHMDWQITMNTMAVVPFEK